jgi:YD repeat-containing protein
MIRSKLIIFYLVLVSLPVILKAQQNSYGTVTIASPTAAALGKYADIPVSYHTGIPQINIPLYTVKAGSLELPIGLSYHASGLKVNETASWVGAGWSLDAGGVITRTVMGLPDEKGTGSGAVNGYGYYTDSGYNKYLYEGPDQDWQGFAQGRKDGEPDLFFFNFGGYSGKFFFRDDHTPVLVPQQDIKIVPYFPNPGTTSIQGFTIITPDGTKYFFGNTANIVSPMIAPVEITNPYSIANGYSSATAISSWFLNKITSFDGQFSLNLTYTSESYGYYTYSQIPLDPYGTGQPLQPTIELGLIKNIISGVRLSQITFPNGQVDFIPGQIRTDLSDDQHTAYDNTNANARSLGLIKISNTENSFCKNYTFNYGYFVDNFGTTPTMLGPYGVNLFTDKLRLRLDSVKETTCDNLLQIPARRFTYFSEGVPRRLSLGVDHWGFINGVSGNQTLIPTYIETNGSTNTVKPGADRSAYWPAMRGGSLNKMSYATGGSAIFDFEPADSYNKSTSSLQLVGIPGANEVVHLYSQSNYTQSSTFVSNGNDLIMTVFNNTQDYRATVTITNSQSAVVYSNTFGDNHYTPSAPFTSGQTQIFPAIPLISGTYTLSLSIPTVGPGPSEGASVSISQLTNVTQTSTIIIGGLRIKTITQRDSANSLIPVITNYSYPQGGFLYSFPTYVQHLRNDLVTNLGFWDATGTFLQGYGANSGCPLSGSYYVRSGGSLRPMSTTQGYHIGYPTVRVSQPSNGYSEYNYYTSNSGYGAQSLDPGVQTVDVSLLACEPSTPNYPPAPLSFDYKKGELYYERHFNQNGDLLKDEYYYPTFDTAALQPAPGFIVASRNNVGGGIILFGTLYNIYSPRRISMHTVEGNYSPGLPGGIQVDTYTYYGSQFHNQVTRKVTTTSTGDSLITKTLYTPDFHSSTWDISPSCEATFTNTCSACQTTYNTARTNCGGVGTCVTNAFLSFRKCNSDARNTYVNSRLTNYTGVNAVTGLPSNNYTTQHNTSKGAAGTELKPILDLQDSGRIVPIEISDYRDASLLKANFTRYDYMPNPAGIPFPNKTQLVNIANPSSTFTNAVISGNSLTKDSRYLDESVYNFLGGNVSKVTGHDGMNSIYIWDYKNTNPIAKTISPTLDSTAFTSFEADGTGNWNFQKGGDSSSQVTVTVNAANTINIFTSQTPVSVTNNDHQVTVGQEVGLKFTSGSAGYISGIRFYKTTGNTGTHTGELYSSTGTRLAQATFTGETATGWQTVLFSSPVTVTAGTTYTAAYFSSLGNYTEDNDYFLHTSISNSPLNAPADGTNGGTGTDPGTGQGTFKYTASAAFPNQLYRSANYWVDVVYSSGTTPVANAGSNQSITLPMSTVTLNSSSSMGIISSYSWTRVSGPNTPTITTPTSVTTTVTGLIAGVYQFQLSVNGGTSTSQVTITVLAAGTPANIFTTQTPVSVTHNDYPANTSIQGVEDGLKFISSIAGTITGIRFYKTTGNAGTHTGELYSAAGVRLAQATFTGETSSGWQTVTFSSPVNITANTTYVAAYFSSLGNYAEDNDYFLGHTVVNGTLTAPLDGTSGAAGTDPGTGQGLYKYTATPAYPDQLYRSANYWVDVLFVTGTSPTASAGNNQTTALPNSTVTLDGSGSSGTITSYLWTKVSGPNNPVITSPTSSTTSVTGLGQGTYVFQLSVNGGSSSSYAITGTKSYNINGNTISKSGLTSGKKYIISYWSRGGACNISGGTSTSTTGRSVSGWTYYEHIVTMTSTTVSVTGSNYIDELRLYPQGAQMSSYTYRPVVGITTMNDPNSEITYYEYDGLERLKNIKDYQGNIVKNYQYNYVDPNACGGNCFVVGMQTMAGTSTLSYPVGVFNLNGKFLGNATNQSQYITIWMTDTLDSHTGTIAAGADSMHFKFTVNSGRTIPNALTGLRYYQYDLPYTQLDAVLNRNGVYVDFGDGSGMYLGKSTNDTSVVKAPNTYNGNPGFATYWIHNYPDSSTKTITFYHNDALENQNLDDANIPATSLMHLKNLRGNLPQNTLSFDGDSYQQASALTVASITNWNSISSIQQFGLYAGDYQNPCLHVSFTQDFMANNRNLQGINTTRGDYLEGYEDSTFKLSKLKTGWNTYFTNLSSLIICDDHWNREDLTALTHLNNIYINAGNTNHSFNRTSNPQIPIPVSVVDNIINQLAAGAGQNISNGVLNLSSAGTTRSSASNTGFNTLKAKGWTIIINGSNL